ncbi:hypothetical protein LOTGIDRAFT_171202 [Lottia gigantea]|uniref:Uncharacterized protein n=1 Tax=Lottia gigantea TaxID=225164 RepID=V4B7S6_LOTGI|nr:hypothetical protein LOTGIDRAFT_171202 [Lottia gigantea]ESP03671.1 hypothetical protein LOTGIDRAFT_171202 [Lottia gigantea]
MASSSTEQEVGVNGEDDSRDFSDMFTLVKLYQHKLSSMIRPWKLEYEIQPRHSNDLEASGVTSVTPGMKIQSADQSEFLTAPPELKTAQSELKTAQSELQTAQSEFQTAQPEFMTAQSEFMTAQSEFMTAQSEFMTAQSELQTAQSELQTAQSELQTAQSEFMTAQSEFQTAQPEFHTYIHTLILKSCISCQKMFVLIMEVF